jgi:hypothetical protein
MQCRGLYTRSATKGYVSCDNLLSLLQLLDLPVVSAGCWISSTHTSAIDSRFTTFWQNHFVEHEADTRTRILIISGPFARRLKLITYSSLHRAETMQWHFLLASYEVFDFQGAEITHNEGRITPSEPYERVLVTECLALNTILYFEVVINRITVQHQLNHSRSYAQTVLY